MFVEFEYETICVAYIFAPSGGVTIRDWFRVIPDAGSVIGQRVNQNSDVI